MKLLRLVLACALLPAAVLAQEPPAPEASPEASPSPAPKRFRLGGELKTHFRHSAFVEFKDQFPFPDFFLPPGQTEVFLRTPVAGNSLELSTVNLIGEGDFTPDISARVEVHFLDLYNRNPTTSDDRIAVREAWLRFGRKYETLDLAPKTSFYAEIGKAPRFTKPRLRRLESYGLWSTAVGRFEELQVELGGSVGRNVYWRAQVANGNPLFFRDPNALAGDNGTPALLQPNPDPRLKSGIPILYDARVQDIDTDGNPQLGLGLGWRTADAEGRNGIDVMAWGRRRKMAKTVDIEGSFYGGDLDLLNGPGDAFPFAVKNDRKRETGANLWLYLGGFSLFGQYVDQDLAGLPRTGIEGEVAWSFDLPLVWSLGERQLFPWIAPAVRYSKLDNDFRNPRQTPSPSFSWDWEKIDAGLRLGLVGGTDLTLEYADNDFILATGAHRNNNEYLATLRWRI